MNKTTFLLLLISLSGCIDSSIDNKFVSTKFINDSKSLKLEQTISNPKNKEFIALFYDETTSLSGNKRLKLYSADNFSIADGFYGAHPMEIINCSDSLINIKVGVFSAHGDSAYRKWYLDNSVDKNRTIGNYKIKYHKNYNYTIK